jgi:hypothetical protein
LRTPRPAAALLGQISARQPCHACEIVDPSEEAYLVWLVRGLANPEFRGWYAASDGLCLPHLRLALAKAEEVETTRFLVQVAVDKLAPLLADLKEYGRKHIWQFRREPKYPWEQASWIRAVAFFAGEAEKGAGERGDWERQRALTEYHTRPTEASNEKVEQIKG